MNNTHYIYTRYIARVENNVEYRATGLINNNNLAMASFIKLFFFQRTNEFHKMMYENNNIFPLYGNHA